MQKNKYSWFSRIFPLLVFSALYGIDQYMNWEYMVDLNNGALTSAVFMIPIIGLATQIALPTTMTIVRNSPWVFNMFLIPLGLSVWILGSAFSLDASMNWMGSLMDKKISEVADGDQARKFAQARLDKANADIAQAEADMRREANSHQKCAPNCKGRFFTEAKDAKQEAEKRKRTAEEELLKAGTKRIASASAYRLKDLGVSPEDHQKWSPVIPVILLLLGQTLFGFAAFMPTGVRRTRITIDNPDDMPEGLKFKLWMDKRQKETGKRPTQAETAKAFNRSKSHISKQLKLVSDQ